MKNTPDHWVITSLIILFSLGLGPYTTWAQPTPAQGKQKTKTVTLNVTAAADPAPAFKHVLFPHTFEQTAGDASAHYLALLTGESRFKLEDDEYEWLDTPLDKLPLKKVKAKLADFNSDTFPLLQRASRYDHCVWPTATSIRKDGFSALLPALMPLRGAARMVALKARVEIAERKYDQAVATLKVGYAMAGHLEEGSSLIEGLVGIAIARMMNKCVEEMIGRPGSPNLYWALTELPRPLVSLRRGLRFERDALRFSFPRLYRVLDKKMTPDQWRTEFKTLQKELSILNVVSDGAPQLAPGLTGLITGTYPKAKKFLIAQGKTAQEIEKMPRSQVALIYELDRYHFWRDQLLKWYNLPYHQAKVGLARTNKRFEKASAQRDSWLAAMLLPAIGSAYRAQILFDQKIEALRLIEALRAYAHAHQGKMPEKLEQLTYTPAPFDPVSGKHFDYQLDGKAALITGALPLNTSAESGLRYRITIAPSSGSKDK